MIQADISYAVSLRDMVTKTVLTEQPFITVMEFLKRGDLTSAVLTTFAVNLILGAFLTTTLPGIIPLIGILGTAGVTFFRGLVIGITYYEVFKISEAYTIVAVGTLLLEFGAYVFSGAAGINLSLSTILPRRYKVESRWQAFKMAWKDTARIFLIVAILLAFGAIWEMTGLLLVLKT